jgi:hypothetical protein
MNYSNYDAKVIERYQTKLVGWTYSDFKSPFDINTIDDIRILLEALQCGRCCWVRMTKSDMNRHRDEINKRKAAGETVGKARQARSDKGTKRPRKSAPGAGEGGDEDGAPPAKKQRKSKAVPKSHTTTTKKAAKKSKKQQLPPARPTSNEFVVSDSHSDTDVDG